MDREIYDNSELIYISDINSYDLLFLNAKAREIFNVKDYKGKKCYELIQGKNSPCYSCNNHLLKKNIFLVRECKNELLNKNLLTKDKLIFWQGKKVRLEVAYDISNKKDNSSVNLDIILKCLKKLFESQDSKEAIEYILKTAGEFLNADRTSIYEFKDNYLINTFEWFDKYVNSKKIIRQKIDYEKIKMIDSLFIDNYFIKHDIQSKQIIYKDILDEFHYNDISSLIAVKLTINDEPFGYMTIENSDFDKSNIALLIESLGYIVSLGLDKIRAGELIKKFSSYDTLTNFRNRNQFLIDTEEISKRNSKNIGIVHMDINGLTELNEKKGHHYGDTIITKVSEIIKNYFNNEENLYRIGGDEFTVICLDIQKNEFDSIIVKLKNTFLLCRDFTVAIGSIWCPNSRNLDFLIEKAEENMFFEKKKFYRFNPPTKRYRHKTDDILSLSDDNNLVNAIKENKFIIHLQPKFSFEERKVIGAEALIRFQNSENELIAPDHFIPSLEEAKLTYYIDYFVFAFALEQIEKWIKKGYEPIPISVNFSRFTLLEKDFLETLNEIYENYTTPKSLVGIEITEGVGDVNGNDMSDIIRKLKKENYSISIDDFGMKYANLSLFSSIEFDVLKLDRSLLADIENNEKSCLLIQALVQICEKMNISLIVEGIETEEQFRILKTLNCYAAQGYLFSKPITVQQFENKYLLSKHISNI